MVGATLSRSGSLDANVIPTTLEVHRALLQSALPSAHTIVGSDCRAAHHWHVRDIFQCAKGLFPFPLTGTSSEPAAQPLPYLNNILHGESPEEPEGMSGPLQLSHIPR